VLAVAPHNMATAAAKVSIKMRMPRILTMFRARPRDLCS
jgi:hypothetical protein